MYGTHPWDLGNPLQSRDVCYDPKKASDIPPFCGSKYFNSLHLPHYISNVITFATILVGSPRRGGCFTNVSRAVQNNLPRLYNARKHIYGENFKPKLCTCTQSHPLGTHDVQSFTLKFSCNKQIFESIFWRAHKMLMTPPPPVYSAHTVDPL